MNQRERTDRALPDLVVRARDGDKRAMDRVIRHMQPVINQIATRYFIPGADHDDVVQHGMEGVYRGVRSYQPGRTGDVHGFLGVCATRRIIAALVEAQRFKHQMLSSSVSLETTIRDPAFVEPATLHEMIPGGPDPAVVVERNERLATVIRIIRTEMSPLERDCVVSASQGIPYVDDKAADNAIQRARRKLRAAV